MIYAFGNTCAVVCAGIAAEVAWHGTLVGEVPQTDETDVNDAQVAHIRRRARAALAARIAVDPWCHERPPRQLAPNVSLLEQLFDSSQHWFSEDKASGTYTLDRP